MKVLKTGIKCCSKCGIEKDVSEFNKNRTTKDGLNYWCKTCRAIYNSENRDKLNKYHVKWCAENKDKLSKYTLKNKYKWASCGCEYRAKNKDKIAKSHRKYRAKNKDKLSKYIAEYYIKNRNKRIEFMSKYNSYASQKVTDIYVKRMLSNEGIKAAQTTPELIEMKRQEILLYRELKNVKGVLNGRTSGRA